MGRLKELIEEGAEVPLGLYKHWAGGVYEVIGMAQSAEDEHLAEVVYRGPVGPGWEGPLDRLVARLERLFQSVAADHDLTPERIQRELDTALWHDPSAAVDRLYTRSVEDWNAWLDPMTGRRLMEVDGQYDVDEGVEPVQRFTLLKPAAGGADTEGT